MFTMFDGRTSLALQVRAEVERYFKAQLFQTVVPRNVRLTEAPSHGQSILQYDLGRPAPPPTSSWPRRCSPMMKRAGTRTGALLPQAERSPDAEPGTTPLLAVPVEQLAPNPYQPRRPSVLARWTSWPRRSRPPASSSRSSRGAAASATRSCGASDGGGRPGKRARRGARRRSRRERCRGARAGAGREPPARGPESPRGSRCLPAALAEFGWTQDVLAQRIGKDRSSIANALRLRRLPEPIQEDLRTGRLTMGHARALLGLTTAAAQLRLRERSSPRTGPCARPRPAFARPGPLDRARAGAPEVEAIEEELRRPSARASSSSARWSGAGSSCPSARGRAGAAPCAAHERRDKPTS